jgi:hypothetical protein
MSKNVITIIFFIFSNIGFTQESLNSISLKIYPDNLVFDIKNDSTNTSTLFNCSESKILAIKLDNNKQVIDSLSMNLTANKYSIVGTNSNRDIDIIYCKDEKTNNMFAISFDFSKKTIKNIAIDLKFNNDNNIYNFSQGDKLYTLFTVKGTSNLVIKTIDFEGKINNHVLNFDDYKLVNYYNKPTNLYKSIGSLYGTFEMKNFSVIDSKTNVSLIEAANKTKIYVRPQELFITFDISKSVTQILNINLKKFIGSIKQIPKPILGMTVESETIVESNSFLIDDKIFQFKLTPELEIITVKNFEGKLLNTYYLNAEKETRNKSDLYKIISPTEIEVQKLKNSKDFLDRSSKLGYGSGIYCTRIDNNYLITFGSVSNIQKSGAIAMFPVFGLTGALSLLIYEKTAPKNFSIYKNRYAVFASLKIDEDISSFFNQVIDFKNSDLDEFISKTKKISNFTISKKGDNQILGYYNLNTNTYNFKEFKN